MFNDLQDKTVKNFLKNKDKVLLFIDDKSYSYDYIKNECLRYKKYEGSTFVYYGDKTLEYIIIFFSSILHNFTLVPLDFKNVPESRLSNIISELMPNFIYRDGKVINLENKKNKKQGMYIMYTSGSQGTPKGIISTGNSLYSVIDQQISEMNLSREKSFFFVSIGFDASISDILCVFFSGGELHIKEEIKLKPKKLVDYFNKKSITYVDIPPSYIRLINNDKFSSLEKVLFGGELVSIKDINLLKSNNKNIKMFNSYGPTEATICTSLHSLNLEEDKEMIPIGLPLKGVTYLIIEDELYIGGSHLAEGYVSKVYNERFVYIDNKRYYKTGDFVFFKNGNYYFLGRKDNQIKKNGQLVNLEEIETELRKKFNKDFICKLENKKIVLYTNLNDSLSIKKHISSTLPRYMNPSKIILVNNLELNSSYKFDRKNIGKTIFISGATGFLGRYLLKDLLEKTSYNLVCCSRNSEDEFFKRVKKEISVYKSRVKYIKADIEKVEWGMKEKDLIFLKDIKDLEIVHCAAILNNLKDIKRLMAANVFSIDFLNDNFKDNTKYLISSLSVFASLKESLKEVNNETLMDKKYRKEDYNNDYSFSKYLAEKKTLNNGNWKIIRPGLLVEDSLSFKRKDSFLNKLIAGLRKEDYLPLIEKEIKIDLTPVDFCSRWIVEIISKNPKEKIFHLSLNKFLRYEDIVEGLNKKTKKEWFSENKHKLVSNFFGEYNPFSKHKSLNIFESTGISEFKMKNSKRYIKIEENEDYKEKYIKFIIKEELK